LYLKPTQDSDQREVLPGKKRREKEGRKNIKRFTEKKKREGKAKRVLGADPRVNRRDKPATGKGGVEGKGGRPQENPRKGREIMGFCHPFSKD